MAMNVAVDLSEVKTETLTTTSFFSAAINEVKADISCSDIETKHIVDIDQTLVDTRIYRGDITGRSPARAQEFGSNQVEVL